MGRFVLVNARFCEITGRSREELLAIHMQDITHPDDWSSVSEKISALVAGEMVSVMIEKRIVKPDGSEAWLRNEFAAVRSASGQVQYVAAAITDVSDRMKIELALRDAELRLRNHAEHLETLVVDRTSKLQDTVHELESFSYSVMHDLRAPIRAMLSFAELLQQHNAEKLVESVRNHLNRISSAPRRVHRLVRHIFSYNQH